MQHTTEDDLELYIMNRAGEEQTAVIEEHVLICEQCRITLDATEQEIQFIRHMLN